MAGKANPCFKCGKSARSNLELFGYPVCAECKSKLGLYKDETIRKQISAFEKSAKKNPKKISFEQEMRHRLEFIEKDYISKKIKLLHVLERLEHI